MEIKTREQEMKSQEMEVILKKDEIFPLITQAQGILDKRGLLPIFSNLLLQAERDSVRVYASDSELSFSGLVSAQVEEEGSLVVNGKQFFDILKELSDSEFSLKRKENNRIEIKQGRGIFHIHGLSPEDYPVFPEIKTNKFQKMETKNLLDVIDKTIYCVSLDESRYHITGVFFESLDSKYRFVATDGHRMSFVDVSSQEFLDFKGGVIIPRKGLQELKKMISLEEGFIEWAVEKPRLITRFNSQVLSIRLIEGSYPDYRQLVPKEKGQEILLDREEFLKSLRRVSVLTSARYKGVNFLFDKNKLSMESSHPELGEAKEEISCVNSQRIHVRFNATYVLDVVNSLEDKKIKIILKDAVSPGVLRGGDTDSYTCVVMPMKI